MAAQSKTIAHEVCKRFFEYIIELHVKLTSEIISKDRDKVPRLAIIFKGNKIYSFNVLEDKCIHVLLLKPKINCF